MSIDTQKFMDLMLYLNMAWASPLQIALAMFFLWQILGPSAMAGQSTLLFVGAAETNKKKTYFHVNCWGVVFYC
jgi:hypothetical protein